MESQSDQRVEAPSGWAAGVPWEPEDAMWLLVAMPDHRIQHLSQMLIGLGVGTWPRLS